MVEKRLDFVCIVKEERMGFNERLMKNLIEREELRVVLILV